MRFFNWMLLWMLCGTLVGCKSAAKENLMIPDVPWGHFKAVETPEMPKISPATTENAIRAGKIGQKIVDANKAVGLRPSIHTIGGEQVEVFHRGLDQIFVTEGLVRQASDPQLAAIISLEMAKMIAEREALEGPMTRNYSTSAPQEVVMFSDRGGNFGAPDGTHMAEIAKYEKRRGGPKRNIKLPDPNNLATLFLKKSGYSGDALVSAQPLIQQSQQQSTFEKQMRGANPVIPTDARVTAPANP
jgi:hypothetical protein